VKNVSFCLKGPERETSKAVVKLEIIVKLTMSAPSLADAIAEK